MGLSFVKKLPSLAGVCGSQSQFHWGQVRIDRLAVPASVRCFLAREDLLMAKLGPKVKDEVLLQKVTVNLTKRGIRPPCRVNVSVRNGVVTLSGTLQYELQRKTAIKAAQEVPGVQRVIDQLQVPKQTAAWHDFEKYRAKPKQGGQAT